MEKNNEMKERPLKKLIAKLGLTQKQIAEKANIPLSAFSSYVAGNSLPRFDNAIALAEVLNISLEELAEAMGFNISGLPVDSDRELTPEDLAEKFSLEDLAKAIGLKSTDPKYPKKKNKPLPSVAA